MATKFLLIRHATTDTVDVKITGRSHEVHLNEAGKRQADELSRQLEVLDINELYSSPLDRARETAGPIAKRLGLEIRKLNEFIEIDFGRWTGQCLDELRYDDDWVRFNSFRTGTRIPEGETIIEVQARLVCALLRLAENNPGKTVAIISHADPIKSILCFFAGIPLDLMFRLEISPASVSILEIDKHHCRVLLINGALELPVKKRQ